MNVEIEDAISKCSICREYSPGQQKEPQIVHAVPDRPWSKIGTDLFELDGKDYVITIDYFSNFFEIDRLQDKKSKEVIKKLTTPHGQTWSIKHRIFG